MHKALAFYKKITRDCWEIGFVEGGLNAVMGDSPNLKINWMRHEFKDRWFADPFVLEVTESEIILLAEEYQYATNKGRIAELVVDRTTWGLKEMNVLLELDTHLSFPAIWREDGRVFVYPESWLSGVLSMYEYLGRGRRLKPVKVICDESMADAIMTDRYGGKLLLSTQDNGRLRLYDEDPRVERFVFKKEMDFGSATARNAGDFFDHGGHVYRPAQVCIRCYGEALEIQEVSSDGEGNLNFRPVKRLYSPHPKLTEGMHTLNTYKGVSVIDVHGWVNPRTVRCIIKLKHLVLGKEWKRKKQE